ncbi:hypothetical protein CMO96_02460 [Candidatus Woesebacteria bacterium]|nr:hypothetical protein [Candidatus Woesebacteria bacterium]
MGDAKKVKAAIYNPYLDTVGGGERYTMTVASVLEKNGWDVDIVWDDPSIIQTLGDRLGIDLSGVNVVFDIGRGARYDFIFWLTDGSIPMLFGKRNVLHFQTPFHNVGGRSLLNKAKLAKISKVVCNSKFTKGFIDKEYGVDSAVIYPPVSVSEFRPAKKENLIIAVGRFSRLQQAKRQDVLIKVFKKMQDGGLKGWKLAVIGGSEVGGTSFVKELRESAKGYPIEILENLPFEEVKKFYAKAKIFWSAAGFGIDEQKNPEKVEHFGITTVEAMSAGCVPIVFAGGGHKETVKDGKNGFLWNTNEKLAASTSNVINDRKLADQVLMAAAKDAKRFAESRFEKEILELAA